MGAERFKAGKVIKRGIEYFEVIKVYPDHKVMIENCETKAPVIITLEELFNELYSGYLSFTIQENGKKVTGEKYSTERKFIDPATAPPSVLERANFRLAVIKPLLDTPRTMKIVESRIAEVNAGINIDVPRPKSLKKISLTTVYRWIKSYEISGRDFRGLYPNYDSRG